MGALKTHLLTLGKKITKRNCPLTLGLTLAWGVAVETGRNLHHSYVSGNYVTRT